MKILTILGSPRKHGNTATVFIKFENLISKLHEVERMNLTDYSVNGCLGCNKCMEFQDECGCIQKDNAESIFCKMMDSDLIIYATPLYVWDFSSQMKTLIDRQYCLVKWNGSEFTNHLLEGKKSALLVTCAGSEEENADLIKIIYSRAMEYAKISVIGKYVVPYSGLPGQIDKIGSKIAFNMYNDVIKV
jgi:multimeric flavodoxin WrbA